MFVHYANDTMLIGDVQEPLSEFLLDEPTYELPAQAIWRIYVPGEKHLLGYGWTQRDEAMPWEEGDAYLAREATYAASYASRHIDTSPNVQGFEVALVDVFGGDYLAINSLYSGWPLFKNALEAEQWMVADLLLSDAYVNYEIDTATYTAIVTTARAFYIPMSLQGRPSILPLNLTDVVAMIQAGITAIDSLSMGLTETADTIVVLPVTVSDIALVDLSETLAVPTSVLGATEELVIDTVDAVDLVPTLYPSTENEIVPVGVDDATPTLVIT